MRWLENSNFYFAVIFTLIIGITACESDDYTPKPKAYFKIELPEKAYQSFSSPNCPFTFEYPVYAGIVWDTSYFDQSLVDQCLFNVEFTGLGGAIHLTYHEIDENVDVFKLFENTHKFTYHHSKKADYIEEVIPENDFGIEMILHRVGGDAASPMQFYATDRKKHYINGSLYFNVSPNADSMMPVIQFVREDMDYLLKTLNWN